MAREGGGGGEGEGRSEAQVGSELAAHLSQGRTFQPPIQKPVPGRLLTFGDTSPRCQSTLPGITVTLQRLSL